MKKILFALVFTIVLFACGVTANAQNQGANFVSAGAVVTLDTQLGYKQPGVGAVFGGKFNLPYNLALTEDLTFLSEQKRGAANGRIVDSNTGLEYYFKNGFFGRAGLQVANDSGSFRSETVSRGALGGGYQFLHNGMPLGKFTVEGFAPFSDSHSLRGVRFEAATYYNFSKSPFGVFGKVNGGFATFQYVLPRSDVRRFSGFEAGFFVNLSAIAGS